MIMKPFAAAATLLMIAAPLLAQAEPPAVRAILPVVGSTAGAFGSNFKTGVQLHNRGEETMRGVLVFHAQGAPASASDPSAAYELAPKQTLAFDDLVASMGASGLGSLDVIPTEGGIPAVVARAYDDRAENGTAGATIRLVDPRDALVPGARGILVLPASLDQFRFNVGVRSLGAGATLRMTVYGQSGIARHTIERSYAAHLFEQRAASDFLGTAILANESVDIEVLAGSAIVYGTTTDNVSNDPSVQNVAVVVQ
jgi:hypothetical protein